FVAATLGAGALFEPALMFIGVRAVRQRRREHEDVCGRRGLRRPYDERQRVGGVAGPEAYGVEAAPEVVRNGEREARLPPGVLEVVVVEVDGGVLVRRGVEVDVPAAPAASGYGAAGLVDEGAVVAARDVHDHRSGHGSGEVPGGDRRRRELPRRCAAIEVLE